MERVSPGAGIAAGLLLLALAGCTAVSQKTEPATPSVPKGQAAPSTARAIALFNQGQERFVRGDYAAAETFFVQATGADPRLHPAFQVLGEAREKLGKKKEAAEAYRRAVRLKPDDAKAHIALGRLMDEEKQTEAALYHFERAAELAPEEFLPRFWLGHLRMRRNQLDAAIFHLRAAVRIDPDHPHARYWLWLALARRGGSEDYEVELGRKVVESGNEEPIRFYQRTAERQFRAGRVKEALRTIRKAVDVNPDWRARKWRGVVEDMERYRRTGGR